MLVSLYSKVDSVIGNDTHDHGLYETDATLDIINKIAEDIKADKKLNPMLSAEALVNILKARGYSCSPVDAKRICIFNSTGL